MKKTSVQKIAVTAMFSALAFAAVLLGKWIPNVAGILSYDPKDSVIAIAGFMMGAPMTLLLSLIVDKLLPISWGHPWRLSLSLLYQQLCTCISVHLSGSQHWLPIKIAWRIK